MGGAGYRIAKSTIPPLARESQLAELERGPSRGLGRAEPPVGAGWWGGESWLIQQARSCARGRPRVRWAGFDRSGSCAQRSFWLQKSTSGAWSSRPRAN